MRTRTCITNRQVAGRLPSSISNPDLHRLLTIKNYSGCRHQRIFLFSGISRDYLCLITRDICLKTRDICLKTRLNFVIFFVLTNRFQEATQGRVLLVLKSEMSGLAAPYFAASVPAHADVLLYLDLDGVVQHDAVFWHPRRGPFVHPYQAPGRTLFEWIPQLIEALAHFPEVRIVLSSTWCIRPGYGKTLKHLPLTLRSRFIGGTFHKRHHGADPWMLESFRSTPRGLQIWVDVQRRKPRHWLALDDDVADWPSFALENLVACDGSTGLSCLRVQRELRQKLLRCHESLANCTGNVTAP